MIKFAYKYKHTGNVNIYLAGAIKYLDLGCEEM